MKNNDRDNDVDSISITLATDARAIIEACQKTAYHAINTSVIERNWLLGERINKELLGREESYGKGIIKRLSEELKSEHGNSYSIRNLYSYVQFYKMFPNILNAMRSQSRVLSWTHYRSLLRVFDDNAREWYARESLENGWSSRTLDRNISTQYYYRIIKTPNPALVESEMKEKTREYQNDKLEFIKNPVVAEFLGIYLRIPTTGNPILKRQ